MSELPERIWATEFSHGDKSWTDNPRIGKYRKEREYIRKDLAQAMVAAAYEDASELLPEAWGASRMEMCSRTPADARAALDAMMAKAREDALREAAEVTDKFLMVTTSLDVEVVVDAKERILALIDRTAEGDT
jgi:hypothetical protein